MWSIDLDPRPEEEAGVPVLEEDGGQWLDGRRRGQSSRQAVGGLKDHPVSSRGRLEGLHTTRVGLWRAGAGVECARKRRACGARRRNRAPLLLLVGFGLLRFHCLPQCTASVWLQAGVWPVPVRASTITLVVTSSSIDRTAQPNHYGPLVHPHIDKQSYPNWPRSLLIGSDTLGCFAGRLRWRPKAP